MFDVVVDPDVIAQLASRLDVLSAGLTYLEWAHLVALLGLGSTALADAVRTGWEPPTGPADRAVAAMGSPGFSDALNPAADAVGVRSASGHRVVIANGAEGSRWQVLSGPPSSSGDDFS
jgi:hypothetical protein